MPRPLPWLALLPGAKTTRPGGRSPVWADRLGHDPLLAAPRRQVAEALQDAARELDDDAWEGIVQAHGERAARARAVAADMLDSPCRPARARYEGAVAQRLDSGSLPASAQRHLVFLSAVAGPTPASDPLPDERLAMGVSLEGVGPLATHWRPHVHDWLAERTRDDAVVWNLLGGEFARALDTPAGRTPVTVRFEGDTGRAAPSSTAKQLRGLVARHLATHGREASDPSRALLRFEQEVAGQAWGAAVASTTRSGVRVTLRPVR